MKKLLIFIILAFVFQSCEYKTPKKMDNKPMRKDVQKNTFHSERIRDTIFENVIEIDDKNVILNKTDYHFNVSIPKSEKTPVIFVSAKVPLEVLADIYPELPNLIVIAPNWNFYEENSKHTGCHEPIASSVIYEFNRENGKQMKDSIVIMGGFPKMNFKTANE